MKNLKDLGEKVAIQCKTQEEWDWVTKELGYKWKHARWNDLKEESCINAGDKGTSRISWYVEEGYTIVQASEFMPLSPQDEIKELKARIATLEELYRPKKKIEFVKYLDEFNMGTSDPRHSPSSYKNVELIIKLKEYDIMKVWDDGIDFGIYLGHFNDGIK